MKTAMKIVTRLATLALLASFGIGCATQKQSDTARTGVEQLLISTAVDRSLDKVDYKPIQNAKVYIEEKYLDCTDKNYVLVALHQRSWPTAARSWPRPTTPM